MTNKVRIRFDNKFIPAIRDLDPSGLTDQERLWLANKLCLHSCSFADVLNVEPVDDGRSVVTFDIDKDDTIRYALTSVKEREEILKDEYS